MQSKKQALNGNAAGTLVRNSLDCRNCRVTPALTTLHRSIGDITSEAISVVHPVLLNLVAMMRHTSSTGVRTWTWPTWAPTRGSGSARSAVWRTSTRTGTMRRTHAMEQVSETGVFYMNSNFTNAKIEQRSSYQ